MHRPCHSCREPSLKGCFWHAVVTEGPFLPRPVTEAVFLPRRRHWKALFCITEGAVLARARFHGVFRRFSDENPANPDPSVMARFHSRSSETCDLPTARH